MLDTRTYNLKKDDQMRENLQQNLLQGRDSQGHCDGYDSSDDESCDLENGDFDTMSSCRSRSRSCCSVTTVANDDFEYFQRKGTKVIWLNFLYLSLWIFNKVSSGFEINKIWHHLWFSAICLSFSIVSVSAKKIIKAILWFILILNARGCKVSYRHFHSEMKKNRSSRWHSVSSAFTRR